MDSGSSHHVTSNQILFLSLKKKEDGYVVFGNNGKGKVMGDADIVNFF